MGDVGGIDRLVHRQDRDRVGGRRPQLADQPRQLVCRQLSALGDVRVQPDDPQPRVHERPVHVGLAGRRPRRRAAASCSGGTPSRTSRRTVRASSGSDHLAIGIVVAGHGEDRRPVVGVGRPELRAIPVQLPVRVDEVAEVVEEASRLRSIQLAGQRPRHPALGQRIDVPAAVARARGISASRSRMIAGGVDRGRSPGPAPTDTAARRPDRAAARTTGRERPADAGSAAPARPVR